MVDKNWLLQEYIKNKRTQGSIAKELGVTPSAISYWLVKYNITRRENNNKRKDISGKRFGRLIALNHVKKQDKNGHIKSHWECRCDCGSVKIISLSSLIRGLTKSCGCLHHDVVYKGHGGLGGQQWSRIRHQALNRGYEFNITIEYAWELFQIQNGTCALSGIQIYLDQNYRGKISKSTASLDRIDNSIGYVEKNIQWVHKDINIMRNKHSLKHFIYLCNKVTTHSGKIPNIFSEKEASEFIEMQNTLRRIAEIAQKWLPK